MNITGSVNGKEPKKYYKYIDIAKGFSIILIVMGHIESGFIPYLTWQKFFMLFHVPIFFMLSGLTINGAKVKKTGTYILSKVKSIYLKALLFYLPAVWLHNLFCKIGFYNAALYPGDLKHEIYSAKEILKQTLLTLGCAGREPILAAMWFVFVLFFALCGYSILSGVLGVLIKDEKRYEGVRTLLIWIAFVISAFLTNHYQFTIKRFSNVFAAIALIHTAYLLKEYKRIKFDNWPVMVISLIGLVQNMEYGAVFMNENVYGNPVFLLSNAVFGTYLICFISRKIERFQWSGFIAFCGKKSFFIMALHVAAFKVLTLVLAKIYPCTVLIGRDTPIVSAWWEIVLYIAAGVVIPVGICKIGESVIQMINIYNERKQRNER